MVDTVSPHIIVRDHTMEKRERIQIKMTWDTKYVTLPTKYKVEATGIKLPKLTQSREVIENLHLFEKPDGTRYEHIIYKYFHKGIGIDVFNGALYYTWNKLKVHMKWDNKIMKSLMIIRGADTRRTQKSLITRHIYHMKDMINQSSMMWLIISITY